VPFWGDVPVEASVVFVSSDPRDTALTLFRVVEL